MNARIALAQKIVGSEDYSEVPGYSDTFEPIEKVKFGVIGQTKDAATAEANRIVAELTAAGIDGAQFDGVLDQAQSWWHTYITFPRDAPKPPVAPDRKGPMLYWKVRGWSSASGFVCTYHLAETGGEALEMAVKEAAGGSVIRHALDTDYVNGVWTESIDPASPEGQKIASTHRFQQSYAASNDWYKSERNRNRN